MLTRIFLEKELLEGAVLSGPVLSVGGDSERRSWAFAHEDPRLKGETWGTRVVYGYRV